MTELPAVPAHRGDQVDDFHGEQIADPYRWLEDTDAGDTREWVQAQNRRTEGWLAGVPARAEISQRLTELWNYPRASAPLTRGGRWFQLRNSGLENQDVLYVMDAPSAEGRVLLDPNTLSEDGTVALGGFSVSEDGERLLYALSEAGSDWMTWRVREVASGEDRPDVISWAKYADAVWLADGSGFVYGTLDRPADGAEYLEAATPHRLALHRLGDDQSADAVVFEAPEHPDWISQPVISDDGRFLIVETWVGTAREARLTVLDLASEPRVPQVLVEGFWTSASYITNRGREFFLLTDAEADRKRIVAVDLDHPEPSAWREVVPEREALLLAAQSCGGQLVCHHLQDACSRLSVLDLDGRLVREIPMPEVSSVTAVQGHPDSSTIQYGITSFTESGSLWQHDLVSGETDQLRASAAPMDPSAFVSEQVFITADDGTRLPVFLTRRADLEPDGRRPVILYGYGGFDISLTPSFGISAITFMERGGIYAVANLRGGGEYGTAWHDAGILDVKQRVFDDFCDCARWLGQSPWTAPAHIAIHGGSNGGLLVAACMIQHPELFGAVVCEVGVLDMLRFHRFTIGWAWKSDYGDPDLPDQYPALRAYSPLHNAAAGRGYPPILITTGDHDDRVVPGHSFKFAATLQFLSAPDDEPVLIRTETSAGHGHGLPTAKAIAKATDVLAFIDATAGA